jgi:hypothetical protein
MASYDDLDPPAAQSQSRVSPPTTASSPDVSLDGTLVFILLALAAVAVGLALVARYFAGGGSPAVAAAGKAATTFSNWVPVR